MTSKNVVNSKSEQFSKLVRQIGQLPHNKNCFDCGQKGPTYVDLTIGAFVCTGCSGILRGLNPPHRVKSISMGTFTEDEVKFMQFRGNGFCKKVWLWNYDPQTSLRPPEVRDDQKMKDYLIAKYEKKRWFNGPNETHIFDQLKQEDTGSYRSLTEPDSGSSLSRRASSNSQRSLRNMEASNILSDGGSPGPTGNGIPSQRTGSSGSISLPRSHTASAIIPSTSEPPSAISSNAEDLFGVFGGLNISVPTPAQSYSSGPPPSSSAMGHTNDWASFARSQTMHSLQPAQPLPPSNHAAHAEPVLPSRNLPSFPSGLPNQAKPAQAAVTAPFMQPSNNKFRVATPAKNIVNASTTSPTIMSSQDKYAALAELDEMMNGNASVSHASPQKSVDAFAHAGWMGTSPGKTVNSSVGIRQQASQAWSPYQTSTPAAAQNPFGYAQNLAPVHGGSQGSDGFHGGGTTGSQGNAGAFDLNNVWGQIPAYNQGGVNMTNPFLMNSGPVATGQPPSLNFGVPQQGPHPTNPFL